MLLFPHLKCSVFAPKRSLKILHNAHHTEAFKLVLTLTTTYRWFNNKVYKSYKFSLGSKVHQKNNRGPANMSEYYAKKGDMYDFPVYDCTQEQKGAGTFLELFDNTHGCLCHERLLRSRNFATIVA